MEGMIGELRAVAESIFLSGNWILLAMVGVAALAGVAVMRNAGQILCASVLAMVVLALVWLVYGGATSESPVDPGAYLAQVESGWARLAETPGTTVVGYLVVFAVAIAVLFIGKSLLFRD